jgi:hypothetical protein
VSADPESGPGGRRARRISAYFPTPLVGVVALLIVLILLTPVLLSAGGPPAAGTILTQAELKIDRVAGGNATRFYVNAEGATVRYASILVTWATGFNWTGAGTPAWNSLNWTVAFNETQVLAGFLSAPENPVALNVTVLYNANGVAYYVGVFAFYVTGDVGPNPNALLALSPTSGVTVSFANPIASLPLVVPLSDVGSGGP